MNRLSTLCLLLLTTALLGSGRGTVGPPSPVSPGTEDGKLQVAVACPTFSFTLAPDSPVSVAIWATTDDGYPLTERVPIDRVDLPRGATSWTLPADRCLSAGKRYAWSAGSVGAVRPYGLLLFTSWWRRRR